MAYQPAQDETLPYVHTTPDLGSFGLRSLDPDRDTVLMHDWLTRDYARFWGMTGIELDELHRELTPTPNKRCLLGLYAGRPAFMTELYNPATEPVGHHYDLRDGDCGMHFIVAPREGRPLPGFSLRVLQSILAFIFRSAGAERVVVEPDVNNDRIHPLNRRAGFRYARRITLPDKVAWLAFCERFSFEAALNKHPEGVQA